tara:strand:- start:4484 stop:5767 length:1284 start_codon:yes stop_codon:yes gene_type:complete
MTLTKKTKLCIVGLGYVGLPLLVEFSKKYDVTGFDLSISRIKNLNNSLDETLEITSSQLRRLNAILSSAESSLVNQDIYIVTVPTPIDKKNKPDISALKKACLTISKYLQKGNYVIFESTVYPGLTEEICVPILEQHSKLTLNIDFFVGYSPERINPGDKNRSLVDITKVVSGSNKQALNTVDDLYQSIITAGTFRAQSIKVAEAAKVIENTQRDINIALMNELSHLFSKMEIDFQEVLRASNTKWNFLDFQPGLVGGHCIGVDPYYLTHKAAEIGFDPRMILAGRATNELVPSVICKNLIKNLKDKKIRLSSGKGLVLGATFKENCPDFRNSKVDDLLWQLKKTIDVVDLYDPYFNSANKKLHIHNDSIKTLDQIKKARYDFVIIAVAHKEFLALARLIIKGHSKKNIFIYDLKGMLKNHERDLTL